MDSDIVTWPIDIPPLTINNSLSVTPNNKQFFFYFKHWNDFIDLSLVNSIKRLVIVLANSVDKTELFSFFTTKFNSLDDSFYSISLSLSLSLSHTHTHTHTIPPLSLSDKHKGSFSVLQTIVSLLFWFASSTRH